MKTYKTRLALASTSLAAAAALVACGGGGGSEPSTPIPAQLGTLSMAITDAPACGFDAVNVTVSRVRVHQSASAEATDAGWSEITLSPARKINLLNLTNGVLEQLGQTPLPVGRYTQVRLVLDANTGNALNNSVLPSGAALEKSLDTPSAIQSGIKLNATFDVVANTRTDLVLDFDACKSVVTKGNGNYTLKPVIKVIPTAVNGISGFVRTDQLVTGVTVSAQQNGNVIAATTPNATTGEFFLARLAPGNYDVVLTGNGMATSVVGAVPVATASSTTALSTSAAPIALAPGALPGSISGTVVLSPASTTEVGYVAAKQTFAAGPTVTVKYAGADLLTGAYTISNLPVVAPQYAAYSASLPLAFTPATTVTPGLGKYTVVASATGYAAFTFPTPVDILVANASNVNFTLVP
ncbi:MAG TPA: DUF4382 domain-containing protein [Telluria sp.]|jgi:hypothetical protein